MPENSDCSKERPCIFGRYLYEEKNMHKEHRFLFVQRKLFFIGALLGLGSINLLNSKNVSDINFSGIAYLVPFIAIAYDIFIFAEDFKVKRIGAFIREICTSTCRDEIDWELYVNKNREPSAVYGTGLLTILAFIAATVIIHLNGKSSGEYFYAWVISILLIILLIFVIHSEKMRKFNKEESRRM
jgi:uncharacterized membrane protein YhaH (DUF805 family)